MPDLDPYSANGGEHRPDLRSVTPFFPSPPAASSSAGTAGGATGTVPPPLPLRGEGLPGAGSLTGAGPVPGTGPVSSTGPIAPAAPAAQPAPPAAEGAGTAGSAGGRAVVKGQIRIEDEVVEKIAALAALEVAGVAALGRGREASETMEEVRRRIGDGRSEPGVRARVSDDEIALELALVVVYGSIVIDVARTVKNNVAQNVGRMLGMKVSSVDVTVEDVRMPGSPG